MDRRSAPDREEVARRAYRRYEERGRAEGNDQADWFEAEREVEEEGARTQGEKRGRTGASEPQAGRGSGER